MVFCLAAQGCLLAQAPRIGLIEFYGVRRVPEKQLRAALGVREGDPLPPSKGAVEERLRHVSGVVLARLEAVCCHSGSAVLYVGVEEKEAPHFEFRPEPGGDASLPEGALDAYSSFLVALERAARSGPVTENLAQGHELSSDPGARSLQEVLFVALARDHVDALRTVLHDSADGHQRACATYLLGYAPDKRLVIDDLQFALRDPDEAVRANAIRALTAIAALTERDPQQGVRVEPTWFIEMLNSLVRGDRVRSAQALVALTEKRSPFALDQIRERALDSLAGMARWKVLEDALPSFIVLGRAAGVSEDDIRRGWTADREALIHRALDTRRK